MQNTIEKTAVIKDNYKDELFYYKSARNGLYDIIKALKDEEDITILLPAYIGYSPREGSGIFDPIKKSEVNYQFYNMDKNINIEIDDLKQKIKLISNRVVVLLVHYFGYVDPNIKEIVNICKDNNAIIIEDCAHAFFTDYVDNKCGRYGNISIYSLHKMFPFKDGGMVRLNNNYKLGINGEKVNYNPFLYNLKAIATVRKENAKLIESNLENVSGIEILRPSYNYEGITPQTFPIIIKDVDKNIFYHVLNNNGYGVVSLYHTMISELNSNLISNNISKKILNLPVHQDVNSNLLINMCNMIKDIYRGEISE